MKLTPLNPDKTLWMVEDVYPQSVIDACNEVDVANLPWEPLAADSVYSQASTPRRMPTVEYPHVFASLNDYVSAYIPLFQETLGHAVTNCATRVWADFPGYAVNRHLDNEGVYASLQVYLKHGPENLGTCFSDSMEGDYKWILPYKPNVGYLMYNTTSNYHGVREPVPNNFIRLSSYTWFGCN